MWWDGGDGSATLEYNLYTTSGYNIVWGDGTGGSSVKTVGQTVTVYNAMIFAKLAYPQRGVRAGEYSDTITITFNVN